MPQVYPCFRFIQLRLETSGESGYAWTDLEGLVLEGALLVLGEAVGDEAGRVGERVVVGLEGLQRRRNSESMNAK